MRRTYRSKKETGGALDHRDVILNLDEKSSAFDAFYIQNIKQTKRELSCVTSSNHAGASSNKVRKKKYVKRIVKEVESARQRDRLSSSTYLTPDKSFRVNKVLDPFDMLLNSSPANNDNPQCDHVETFVPNKKGKTYARKRRLQIKKLNYSSNDSTESDKENSTYSNVTDIRMHELVIEKAPVDNRKSDDDSIKKILNNLPLKNYNKHKDSNKSFNTSYRNRYSRLTKAYQSPMLQKSPFCSTPFKEKYRGVSIFKFSPISQKAQETSNEDSILEDNDDNNRSIVLVSKSLVPKPPSDYQISPLAAIPNYSIENMSNMQDSKEKNSLNVTEDKEQNTIELVRDEMECKEDSLSHDHWSSLQKTETELFLGFSNNGAENLTQDRMKMLLHLKLKENLSMQENSFRFVNKSKSELNKTYSSDTSTSFGADHNELQSTKHDPDDTRNINRNELETNKKDPSDSSINIDARFDGDQTELVTNKTETDVSLNATQTSVDSNKCNTSGDFPSESQSSANESLYNTCNNDETSAIEEQEVKRESIVAIERMNDSIFYKYHEKMLYESQHKELSEEADNDNKDSIDVYSKACYIEPDPIVLSDSCATENDISNEDEYDEEEVIDDKEEKYISFVTTRRRNEIAKDSMFMFEQSYCSSSTDCDKTVLSNIKVSLGKLDEMDVENKSQKNEIEVNTIVNCENKKTEKVDKDIILKESAEKCSKLTEAGHLAEFNGIPKFSENLANAKILRMATRKSSRGSRQTRSSCISKLNESLSNKRISRMKTRKSSRLSKRSYSISSGSDADRTVVDTNEDSNNTIVEIGTLEKELSNLENLDVKTPLPPESGSCMFKESAGMIQQVRFSNAGHEVKPTIVLQPGKKWERSLSIYRRMTMAEHTDHSILDDSMQNKGRKYRQSVLITMEMQDSLHNDSINSRRSTFVCNTSRPTIRFVKDPNFSRVSLNRSSVFDDLKGFLSEECDDTVIELSKLSIADSDHEITVLDNFHELERVTTARDFVLRRCNQTEAILFDECYPETVLKNCHKIGEGVYGEVFLWRGRDGRARVMKIVPIAGTVKVNGEAQKDFHEIISEIVIAMELSALRAPIADIERQLDDGSGIHELDLHAIQNATDIFNEVLAVRCVYGPYPSRLLDLWELYDECKGSENDNPAALPADQRYIVLELANAGQDLESFQFASAQQAHALFQQIAFGLAVAEEAFQFEHRDLHWGNVLIAPTEQKFATFVLRGRTVRVPRRGVAGTVIDYSLSRVSLALPAAGECAALYNDLATDDQLFDAVGDYQFEVYRLMRDKLGNDWKNFEPYTNILWLHYIVDKMITALRYKRTNTKIHKHHIEKLKAIKNSILEYGSAVQFVLTGIEL